MTDIDVGGDAGGASTAGREAGSGASAKEMAAAAVDTVKQEAMSFAESAKDKVAEQVEQKKQVATETLGDFANAIRKAGDELSQNDQSMAARLVKQAADGLEGLSRSVGDKRPEEMLDAVRGFGRSNPTAFIAGSVLLGLALGRFARSSEQHGASAGPDDGTLPSQDFGGGASVSQDANRPEGSSFALGGGAPPPGDFARDDKAYPDKGV